MNMLLEMSQSLVQKSNELEYMLEKTLELIEPMHEFIISYKIDKAASVVTDNNKGILISEFEKNIITYRDNLHDISQKMIQYESSFSKYHDYLVKENLNIYSQTDLMKLGEPPITFTVLQSSLYLFLLNATEFLSILNDLPYKMISRNIWLKPTVEEIMVNQSFMETCFNKQKNLSSLVMPVFKRIEDMIKAKFI